MGESLSNRALREGLLAEAVAWRTLAEFCLALEGLTVGETDGVLAHWLWLRYGALQHRMAARTNGHMRLAGEWDKDRSQPHDFGASALRGLLLALECEDEARALNPKRSSPKKRPSKGLFQESKE